MTDLAEFFLASPPRVVLLDCLEISHPNFSQTYRIVRNAPSGVTVTHSGEPVTEWVFDGVDDEVSFGDVFDKGPSNAWSLFGWYKTTVSNPGALIGKQSAASAVGWRLVVNSSLGEDFIFTDGSGHQIRTGSAVDPPTDGEWHMFGITLDGSGTAAGCTFYIDGSPVAQTVLEDDLTGSTVNGESLKIGRRGTTLPFVGSIMHVSVWDSELSALEVAEVYGGGTPPDLTALAFAADLEFWVKLDAEDGSGAGGVNDYGPGGHDGTSSFDPTIVEEFAFDYEYYPARVMPVAATDDMVQALSVSLGDVGDVIAAEIERVWEANGMGTRPTLTYRGFRSDDLSAPIKGPITLELVNVTTTKYGAEFEARAPELNATRTGELYTLERFPMLRGFMS